jgi:UDP-N-acetylmuramoylalanine--D-glutamate ligase
MSLSSDNHSHKIQEPRRNKSGHCAKCFCKRACLIVIFLKARIFDRLGGEDTAVVGVDDPVSAAIADNVGARSALRRISVRGPVEDGVYADGHALIEVENGNPRPAINLEGIGSLRGAHNAQNAAAAFALCRAIGLGREEIADGLASFPGLPHRMEEVGRLGGVLFINDSKATNADAAAKALASFKPIYWIAGGLAKAGGLDGLEAYFPNIAHAYFIGEAAGDFARAVEGALPAQISVTLDAAIRDAARDAASSGDAEPVVLLSPACASYDQFPNFTVRGDAFRDGVAALEGIIMRENAAA